MDNFEGTKITMFYSNLDNFRFKRINMIKFRKVSQICQYTLVHWFAIYLYSNLCSLVSLCHRIRLCGRIQLCTVGGTDFIVITKNKIRDF